MGGDWNPGGEGGRHTDSESGTFVNKADAAEGTRCAVEHARESICDACVSNAELEDGIKFAVEDARSWSSVDLDGKEIDI